MKTKVSRKQFTLSLLLVILLAFAAMISAMALQPATASAAETIGIEKSTGEVVTYLDVFQSYYDIVLEETQKADKTDVISFEEFCDKFYSFGMDLPAYTDAVISHHLSEPDGRIVQSGRAYNELLLNNPEITTNDSILPSVSNDADYILSSTDYAVTPASEFVREPVRGTFVYSVLQEGDIVHETDTILFNAGHNAIIYNLSKSSAAYGTYIQTIEAVGGGVQFGFLDDTRMVEFRIMILRVYGATPNIRNTAKAFSHAQLGKPYSLNIFRLNTDIHSDKWYCSELVYAAYKYAGVDIGVKNGNYLQLGCLPNDIFQSDNTYSVSVPLVPIYLSISIVRKTGITWTINVANTSSIRRDFQYNTKMCFEGDASGWRGLNHIVDDYIEPKTSKNIEISENVFATCVVVSWVNEGTRLITYGKGLRSNGAMNVFTSYQSA